MDGLIEYIWELRNDEGMPIHFRRNWQGNYNKRPLWYIWYGYKQIAWRANLNGALNAVDIAASVHRAIHD
jgi:hypothetical protein